MKIYKVIICTIFFLLLSNCSLQSPKKENPPVEDSSEVTVQTPQKSSDLALSEEDFVRYYIAEMQYQEEYSENPELLAQRLGELRSKEGYSEADMNAFRKQHQADWSQIWNKIEEQLR